jgi:hypothetical protein
MPQSVIAIPEGRVVFLLFVIASARRARSNLRCFPEQYQVFNTYEIASPFPGFAGEGLAMTKHDITIPPLLTFGHPAPPFLPSFHSGTGSPNTCEEDPLMRNLPHVFWGGAGEG